MDDPDLIDPKANVSEPRLVSASDQRSRRAAASEVSQAVSGRKSNRGPIVDRSYAREHLFAASCTDARRRNQSDGRQDRHRVVGGVRAPAAERPVVSRRIRAEPLRSVPTVSVVIPCYNYGHYLPTSVGSVLKQDGVSVEVILIDDASPDGSAEVVRRLAATDDRIHPILHARNRGHITTYNEGLALASGEYVVLLSADDALTPGALARAAALFEANPSVGLVYGHPVVFGDDPPPVTTQVRSWTVWPGHEWIERRCRSGRNCIMNPEAVMRTSVQHAIGGYDAGLPHSGDLEMWMRAATISDVGRVNGAPQGFYRVHDKSMMRTTYAGHSVDLDALVAAFEKVLVGPGATVAGGEALLAAAKRALAASALECARSACDHGRAAEEPVDDYLAFAGQVWPGVRRTRKWRALARYASADSRRVDHGLGPIARRVAEDVRWRVRWRRWRWTGV